MTELRFHAMPDGRRIAFRFTPGAGPALVFLPGYKSDMSGSKALAVLNWALANGRACLLLDYSGCGQSSGNFADGTLSRWTEEVIVLVEAQCAGQVVLVGSSMGGWLMLIAAAALGHRVAGIVGIAAAPDFIEWGIGVAEKAELAAGRIVLAENPYGPEPTPTHPGFYADALEHLMLDAPIAFDGPVRLLHGQADGDVPWNVSIRLAAALRSADVQVLLIKNGDHRLSRPADIALLLRTIETLSLGETLPLGPADPT
jgi:pimeloyl-ACP methyl ester carboxylesterase